MNGIEFVLRDDGESYRVESFENPQAVKSMPAAINELPVTEISPSVENWTSGGYMDDVVLNMTENINTVSQELFAWSSARFIITVNEHNPYFRMENGCIVDLRSGLLCKATKNFERIPDTVRAIGDYAF